MTNPTVRGGSVDPVQFMGPSLEAKEGIFVSSSENTKKVTVVIGDGEAVDLNNSTNAVFFRKDLEGIINRYGLDSTTRQAALNDVEVSLKAAKQARNNTPIGKSLFGKLLNLLGLGAHNHEVRELKKLKRAIQSAPERFKALDKRIQECERLLRASQMMGINPPTLKIELLKAKVERDPSNKLFQVELAVAEVNAQAQENGLFVDLDAKTLIRNPPELKTKETDLVLVFFPGQTGSPTPAFQEKLDRLYQALENIKKK
jgi:hypothetical protein